MNRLIGETASTQVSRSSVVKSQTIGCANCVDCISNLPEIVISHILSCLPTKDAVRTCILSKDWEFKWTSIYNIDIDDEAVSSSEWHDTTTFVIYVERILLLSQNIRSFRLQCCVEYDLDYMSAWISAVLRRNVKSLEVIYPAAEYKLILPRSLLNNTSLRRLKLELPCHFKVPFNNRFPKLESLYLYGVEIRNELSSSDTLIFTFPVLETLELLECKWLNVKFVKIIAPALTKFTSETPANVQVDEYAINILGGRLTDFESSGHSPEHLILTGSSIVNATLTNLGDSEEPRVLEKSGLQVRRQLKGFTNLEDLVLSRWIMEAIVLSKQHGPAFPIYEKLRDLCLHVCSNIEALVELLHAAPCLKFLDIDSLDLPADGYDYEAMESLPSCVVSSLEKVELSYNEVRTSELRLTKFLLKNGLQLKEFDIFGYHRTKKEILKFLSTFRNGSSSVIVTVN